MKIWHFTEGAYPHLPPEEEYDSIRITLPNRHYDPKLGADLYHRFIDEWQVADEEGLNMMVNEHHQTPTCVNPAAPITLGILARVTKKARMLILGNPIANRSQPVRVAEEMAMVDVMSRGRLECGFVRSVPYEIPAGNSNPVRLNERMWEAHDLIVKAWTTHDGPFSHEGRYFHHRLVNIWPRPWQQPHPPIWIASTSPQGASQVGERGHTLATFLTGYAQTPKTYAGYREGWKKGGHKGPAPVDRFAYAALVHVGESEEAARTGGQKILWYLTHNKIPPQFRNPPGYNPAAANVAALRAQVSGPRGAVGDINIDAQIAKGTMLCGTPDQVFQQIKKLYDHVGGFGNLLSMGQAGFLDHKETTGSMRLLAREVLPRLQELTARPVAAE